MQDGRKAVWSIPYVSVAFFPSLKQNFIAYRSSSRPDCIFEIHQLWQSGFSRVYSNCCRSCSFTREIIKISQSSHKMYSYNILKFQESTTILNASTKMSGNLLNSPRMSNASKAFDGLRKRLVQQKPCHKNLMSCVLFHSSLNPSELCRIMDSIQSESPKSTHLYDASLAQNTKCQVVVAYPT